VRNLVYREPVDALADWGPLDRAPLNGDRVGRMLVRACGPQPLPVPRCSSCGRARWSLDQAVEAYAEFDKQSSGKGVFDF